jgi:phosphatidylserine/phosphatidylglycerophosphate/cardiolipin synthase-like enzyme
MMHSKYFLIDGTVGPVGSYNLDYSSTKNGETVVVFEGKKLGEKLKDQFYKDLEYSKQITLEEMEEFKRPQRFINKVKLKIFKLVEKFL